MSLKETLDDWRLEAAIEKFGEGNVRDLGPGLIISMSVIERIVTAVHYRKLNNIQDLRNETGWQGSSIHAAAILNIITRLRPPPTLPTTPFVSTPLQARSSNGSIAVKTPATTGRHCSLCGNTGHNGELNLLLS